MQQEVVKYLKSKNTGRNGWQLKFCTERPFSKYLQDMARSGTNGDKLTLGAVPYIFHVELTMVSIVVRDG